MYTLKGLFPEPKKEPKKNFIKENMKQLKSMQDKNSPKEPKFTMKNVQGPRLTSKLPGTSGHSLRPNNSTQSNKSGKALLPVGKNSFSNKKSRDLRIKKGDMTEFLKRKAARHQKPDPQDTSENVSEDDSGEHSRDIGCQTIESMLSKGEQKKLTQLYPIRQEEEKGKASGDSKLTPNTPTRTPRLKIGDNAYLETERRSRINTILEQGRRDKDPKDPYLPAGYQKGVVPKYIRERKDHGLKDIGNAKADDETAECPPGHVTLPDNERKETLRMLRNSFGELVSELNKMPVKTDTLRMRNRKAELEKQLAKLEEGIKVFSRAKVFVKMGE